MSKKMEAILKMAMLLLTSISVGSFAATLSGCIIGSNPIQYFILCITSFILSKVTRIVAQVLEYLRLEDEKEERKRSRNREQFKFFQLK